MSLASSPLASVPQRSTQTTSDAEAGCLAQKLLQVLRAADPPRTMLPDSTCDGRTTPPLHCRGSGIRAVSSPPADSLVETSGFAVVPRHYLYLPRRQSGRVGVQPGLWAPFLFLLHPRYVGLAALLSLGDSRVETRVTLPTAGHRVLRKTNKQTGPYVCAALCTEPGSVSDAMPASICDHN